MGMASSCSDSLCQSKVHILIDSVILELLAWSRMRGIAICLVLSLSLDRDVKLRKSRQQSRDILIGFAQFSLVVCVFRLVAGKLAGALHLETFILSN